MRPTSRIRGATFGFTLLFIASACGVAPTSSPSPAAVGYEVPSIAVSTTAGDVIASQDVTPEQDAVIEGTGPDGTVFKLEIPAYAVIKPITISLRPLVPTAIDGGKLVAGVELEPAGTTFALPVTLMITPAEGEPFSLVPFAYTGSPENATASLAMTDSIDADSLRLVVAHFSGIFVAKPPSPEVQAKWEGVGKQPDPGASTPEQQAAWAEAAMAAAKYDMEATKAAGDASSMASQTRIDAAQSVYDHASEVWIDAQMASWDNETSKVGQIAKDGNLDYATEFQQEIDKVAVPAVTAAKAGKLDATTVINQILDVVNTYLGNIAKALDGDRTFQESLAKGTPEGLTRLNEIAQVALSANRQIQLLGRPDAGAALLGGKMWGWMSQYARTFGARCQAGSYTEPVATIRYARLMALLGDDGAVGPLMDCATASAPFFPPPKHTPNPCPSGSLSLGPPLDGTQVAEVPACGPGASAAPPPAPGSMEPVMTHGTMTGHTTFPMSGGDVQTADIKIEADLRWDFGLGFTGMNAVTLAAARYAITGTATGSCSGSATKSGSMAYKDENSSLAASGDGVDLDIIFSSGFANNVGFVSTHGGIMVPTDCQSGWHLVAGVFLGNCRVVLALVAPGVLDGTCKDDTQGSWHSEWTVHFSP